MRALYLGGIARGMSLQSAITMGLVLCASCRASTTAPPAPLASSATAASATSSVGVAGSSPSAQTISVRAVVRGSTSAIAIAKRTIALTVRSERDVSSLAVPTPPTLPSWLPPPVRVDETIHATRTEDDGSVLAWSRHTLLVFDATHRFEGGLDFEPFRGDVVRHVPLGGDHATLDRGTVIRSPHRIGSTIFVAGSDAERDDTSFLLAVDLASGTTLWKTAREMAPSGFAVVSGNAIASTRTSGRAELVVVDLATGHVASRVPTARGPYRLEIAADGTLRGYLSSNEVATPDEKSVALDVAVDLR